MHGFAGSIKIDFFARNMIMQALRYVLVVVVFLLVAVVLALSPMYAQAQSQSFQFYNYANSGICFAPRAGQVVGWYCSSPYTYVALNDWKYGNRIRFSGTNLCMHASTPTTVIAAPCQTNNSRQRWSFEAHMYNFFYGKERWLMWNGVINGNYSIGLTNTYWNDPKRWWGWRWP